ncbi:hypothetical protein Y1Q_0010809 [Alligator mississippiensis]|uniref:Uncharacterized protein n=1 Tax=Alligator mississippiensis TaxID=8496 RepID=A0A151M6V6_ALLMI|nr:hypothetical protein Y1Q_0010809 [Alligator mississippiensis]
MEENSSNMQVAQKHICASNSGAKFDKGLRKARLSNTLQRLKRDGHPLQSLKPPFGKAKGEEMNQIFSAWLAIAEEPPS